LLLRLLLRLAEATEPTGGGGGCSRGTEAAKASVCGLRRGRLGSAERPETRSQLLLLLSEAACRRL
jgi:hypothetical protein